MLVSYFILTDSYQKCEECLEWTLKQPRKFEYVFLMIASEPKMNSSKVNGNSCIYGFGKLLLHGGLVCNKSLNSKKFRDSSMASKTQDTSA